jgi:ABC-type multidrug transport system ATPase subunit
MQQQMVFKGIILKRIMVGVIATFALLVATTATTFAQTTNNLVGSSEAVARIETKMTQITSSMRTMTPGSLEKTKAERKYSFYRQSLSYINQNTSVYDALTLSSSSAFAQRLSISPSHAPTQQEARDAFTEALQLLAN